LVFGVYGSWLMVFSRPRKGRAMAASFFQGLDQENLMNFMAGTVLFSGSGPYGLVEENKSHRGRQSNGC